MYRILFDMKICIRYNNYTENLKDFEKIDVTVQQISYPLFPVSRRSFSVPYEINPNKGLHSLSIFPFFL